MFGYTRTMASHLSADVATVVVNEEHPRLITGLSAEARVRDYCKRPPGQKVG